jgi:uncharacterized membrane protein YedE/YeeE
VIENLANMSALRELIAANGPAWLALGGLLIGLAFGAIVFVTNFCTMGAVSDIANFGDWRRFRSWLLAAATALLGTQLLQAAGAVELTRSMYLAPSLNWGGNIAGGLMFGFGMVFAGGCASRNLARVGGGDLRALMTLIVLGLFAYMAIGGVLGPLRAGFEVGTSIALAAPTQGIGDLLGAALGLASGTTVATVLIVGGSLAYCFKDRPFRSSPIHIASGVGVGLCVILGWALTGLAYDEMAHRPVPPISLTYVRPTGDALEWLQRFTATPVPGFGVASVFGAIAGAFAAAVAKGQFRLTTFADQGDTMRNLGGAALMGIGGVMALGCTIGQGVTGVSTLALGSYITFVSIVLGALLGIKAFERWIA